MGMSTVAAYAHFMFEKTSRAGCGGRLPRIENSQNWALESTTASQWANFSALSVNTGQFDPYLLLVDLSQAGYGGGLTRIAHSRNWALESASTPPGPPI